MSGLATQIQERIQQSQIRIAGLRASISEEEQRLKKWQDALELEIGARELDSGSTADAMTPLLTLDSVRTKPSMIVSLLQRYAEGLTAAQIHQLLAPAVARSAVFQILKRLETQRLVSKSGQTFRLVAGQDQQHPAISGVL